MNRSSCLFFLLLCALVSQAQVAEWVIPPHYDNMYISDGTDLLIADSTLDSSLQSSLWTLDGKCLLRTQGVFFPFHDDVSVITNRQNAYCLGFVSEEGAFVQIQEDRFAVDLHHPYFSNDHLLVSERLRGVFDINPKVYRYIAKNGDISSDFYEVAFPFFNGYASCRRFRNPDRPSAGDVIPYLLSTNLKPVQFSYNGKPIKESRLDFISSVNDAHVAIVVADRMVYVYQAETKQLSPLCAKQSTPLDKEQAETARKYSEFLRHIDDSTWVLKANCGRKVGDIFVFFDRFMRPKSIQYVDTTVFFQYREYQYDEFSSSLSVTSAGGLIGLVWGKETILPPQFERVPIRMGNNAVVVKDGKYGWIRTYRSSERYFDVTLDEKSEPVIFKHKKYNTKIQVDLPKSVLADDGVSIIKNNSSLWDIDLLTKNNINTTAGSRIEYDCSLPIPQELFEQESATINYPIQIQYNGFLSPLIDVTKTVKIVRTWGLDGEPTNQKMEDGKFSFDFKLEDSGHNDNDREYWLDVKVLPDFAQMQSENPSVLSYDSAQLDSNSSRLYCVLTSHSKVSYSCVVYGLAEGVNVISIEVTEDGLPTTSIPISITYTRTQELNGKKHATVVEDVTLSSKSSVIKKRPAKQMKKTSNNDDEPVFRPGGIIR